MAAVSAIRNSRRMSEASCQSLMLVKAHVASKCNPIRRMQASLQAAILIAQSACKSSQLELDAALRWCLSRCIQLH